MGISLIESAVQPIIIPSTITSTRGLRFNQRRAWVLVINDSDTETVYLGLDKDAVLNQGIRLNPGGSSFEINATNPYTGEITCISSGNANVIFMEISR